MHSRLVEAARPRLRTVFIALVQLASDGNVVQTLVAQCNTSRSAHVNASPSLLLISRSHFLDGMQFDVQMGLVHAAQAPLSYAVLVCTASERICIVTVLAPAIPHRDYAKDRDIVCLWD
jgi:hypothetical protein